MHSLYKGMHAKVPRQFLPKHVWAVLPRPIRFLHATHLATAQVHDCFRCPQTFEEADLAKDGRISQEEWMILVKNQPVILNFMTLPVLRNVTTKYPSFIFNKAC